MVSQMTTDPAVSYGDEKGAMTLSASHNNHTSSGLGSGPGSEWPGHGRGSNPGRAFRDATYEVLIVRAVAQIILIDKLRHGKVVGEGRHALRGAKGGRQPHVGRQPRPDADIEDKNDNEADVRGRPHNLADEGLDFP